MTWAERAAQDSTLRDFVDAEIARAGVSADTVRWQLEHKDRVIAALTEKLSAATKSKDRR